MPTYRTRNLVEMNMQNKATGGDSRKLAPQCHVRFKNMKQTFQLTVFLCLAAFSTGCATSYITDRGRDAADVFTFGVGVGAGAKARIGPIQTGLLFNIDALGLRGGEMVWKGEGPNIGADIDYLLGGHSEFDTRVRHRVASDSLAWKRNKSYMVRYGPLGIPANDPFSTPLPNRYSLSYFTQVEVVGGLLWTFRLGFNPGELLDFIFGWFTVDIYNDDLEKRESNKPSQSAFFGTRKK